MTFLALALACHSNVLTSSPPPARILLCRGYQLRERFTQCPNPCALTPYTTRVYVGWLRSQCEEKKAAHLRTTGNPVNAVRCWDCVCVRACVCVMCVRALL